MPFLHHDLILAKGCHLVSLTLCDLIQVMSCALLGHTRLLTDSSLANALAIFVMLLLFFLLHSWMRRVIGGIFLVEDLLSHLLKLLPHVTCRRIVVLVNIDNYVVVVNRGGRGSCDTPTAGARRGQIFSSSTTCRVGWWSTTSCQRLVTLREGTILDHTIRNWTNSWRELLGWGLVGCSKNSASPCNRHSLLHPSLICWR